MQNIKLYIHGRRAYIGNIEQNGKTFPDRIIKSQVNKFDTFPEGIGLLTLLLMMVKTLLS